MARARLSAQQRADKVIKNTLTAMVKYISIIAIFVSLGIILLLYLGPEINLSSGIVFKLAVPSIVLSISTTIVYELWITNGRRNASEEVEYQELMKLFITKSENLNYTTTQEFLDEELKRRYTVEHNRLTRRLERETELIAKLKKERQPGSRKLTLKDKYELWVTKRNISSLNRALDTIRIVMPYEKSEEFDYLRYNLADSVYKEYAPRDTKKHLAKKRTSTYIKTFTFTIIGLNALSIGGSMGDIWVAIIMTSLAATTLGSACFGGFSTGYHNIKVVSTGVYKTANSFLDQAVAYCKKTGKDLYYKGTTEFREVKVTPVVVPIVPIVQVPEEADIFTKASLEVTQS